MRGTTKWQFACKTKQLFVVVAVVVAVVVVFVFEEGVNKGVRCG
jgi:preprotein translocase subunit SecF